jgi:hypothetical protein
MGRDFALKPEDRDKVIAAADSAEEQILQRERERIAAERMAEQDGDNVDRGNRENFRIKAGSKLPEKFINPPCGDDNHLCVDMGGVYRPDWSQLMLFRLHEGQADPQTFPLGSRWKVPLEKWVDVPPEVMVSLGDAVETHHRMDFMPGDILLGKPATHSETNRRRFQYDTKRSA